jgi:RNA polymerase sigma factor (sigma-70 family)
VTQSQIAPDTDRLVRDAQAGDTEALDELIAGHLPLIYNIIGRALAGHPDVDDVVQETMLRAVRGLPTLREPDRFRSWLVSIAYRQIQLHLRDRQRTRQRRLPEPVEVPDPVGDFAERTAAELVVADQRRELVEAARWLDDGDRRLLGLWWQEAAGELTRTELAAAIDVRPKHAAVRVQRMKAQLDAARGVVRAMRARPRCAELTGQLRRWDGVADPLWRKRLVRHVRECPQCAPRRSGLVAPEELLLGIAALPVPAAVLTGVAGALKAKVAVSVLPTKALLAATAATVAVSGGVVFAVYQTPAPDADVAVAPPATVRPSAPAAVIRTRAPSPTPTARPVIGLGVQRADIYVAPGGSDSADGSAARPYATLGKAVSVVRPGQTIALRGGTYRPAAGIGITTSGTAAKRIVLSNYRDERPRIDAGGIPADQWAITQQAGYWTVQGLEIFNSKSHAYVCRACRDSVFQRLSLHDNVRSGMMLRDDGTIGNRVLDSDFAGGGGIGLGVQFGSGDGNLVRGNRFAGNAASGLDLSFGSPVKVEYNWSYDNGGNGFVLTGSGAHELRHNAAWDNQNHGFTDDAGGANAALSLTNNTAFHNGGTGFALPTSAVTLRSNTAVDNAAPVSAGAAAAQSRNSWQQQPPWTAAVFRSTDPAVAESTRPPTGKLPTTDFLTTGNGIGASMTGT